MRQRFWIALAVLIFALWAFGGRLVALYVDLLWADEVGYRSVLLRIIETRLLLAVLFGFSFFAIVYGNIWVARRWAPPVPRPYADLRFRERAGILARQSLNFLLLAASVVVALIAALEASNHWQSFLLYTHPVAFGEKDPIFNRDISFYVFRLPFILYAYRWLVFTLVLTFAVTAGVHYFDKALQLVMGVPRFAPHVKVHLSILAALILFVKAWGYKLASFNLLFSNGNVLYGAAYTDVHARLPGLNALQIAAVLAGVLILLASRRTGILVPAAAIGGLASLSVILGIVYPSAVQSMRVVPNEPTLERPYIANHIRATLKAYGLEHAEEIAFPGTVPFTAEIARQHESTIQNIRLWDHIPLLNAYRQQQSLRPYYEFASVDVDRYTINGQKRQVMLSARELNPDRVPVRRWSGRRLQYTHGYGLVMNQVNAVSQEGWPEYVVKDIDPIITPAPELRVTRPQLYYGEISPTYNIVNTRIKEFDHPRGDTNVMTSYQGRGGFPVGGGLKRMALAMYFKDVNFLLSRDLTPSSRLMFRRRISERISAIAPFLLLDPDPYLVLYNGGLYWLVDAYTVSDTYPYSLPGFEGGYNYLRNSVKIVVDAYNGSVTFYIADPKDPIVRSYSRIFPRMFVPIERMPTGLREHIRYPELLFNKQTEMYSAYHMRDPLVFYQKEDLWTIASERGSDSRPGAARIEAYYVMMRLPDSNDTEMVIMRPFTARGKDNMVAWMAARCDGACYGEIKLFKFPKTALAEGPSQVEARINNDPTISPQISLWDQRGSQVIHGHLLVIPIGRTVLYVRPLYLQAEAATSPVPELARIILASDHPRRVVMERTLDDAVASLLGTSQTSSQPPLRAEPVQPQSVLPTDVGTLAENAWQQLQAAETAQRQGDWAGYGRQLQQLRQTLQKLRSTAAR
ncbi:MAG: UPF0182 family membrane protein [Armatimonadota bacterium]